MTRFDSKRLWRRKLSQKALLNFQCVYCGEFHELHNLSIDHVRTQMQKGGRDITTNVVPPCRRCNRGKRGVKTAPDWVRSTFGGKGPGHTILST
ncbi:MAG: hypothetical protein CM15mL6_040 [uncultured marine virus]|nr:MAG: hypothetical protein CM15mL6_040 [uncultured marine virus]